MSDDSEMPDRDYGKSWRTRLADARERAARPHIQRSEEENAQLREAAHSLDVSSACDRALFWSGKDILTAMPLDESSEGGPVWWDKHAPLNAQVFRQLGLAESLEDTVCGKYILGLELEPSPTDPFAIVLREVWDAASARFAEAVKGRVEILSEGAWEDGVFRAVEWEILLRNRSISCINGLDRTLFPNLAGEAFVLLRRWDIERNRRYVEFLRRAPDATTGELELAVDDYREIQLWYEQDFYGQLGPNRALPPLPPAVLSAPDATKGASAWKYARTWREFARRDANS